MSRFLLAAMPFTGHVTPVLAVAEALIARGHAVRCYTGSAFRGRVEASGATLVPWESAPDFDENDLAATFPRLVGKKGIGQVLVNVADAMIGTAPAQVDDLTREYGREPWDVMAGDETCVGTALYAEKTGRPWATLAVLPLNMIGPDGPPSGFGLVPGTTAATRLRDAALRGALPLLSWPLRAPLARARAAIGLAPSDATFDKVVFSPRLVVASGAPRLDYTRTDRPPHVHFVGELTRATDGVAPAPLPPWWSDLDDREVVYVTQGTQNIDPDDLIRPALRALDGRDIVVVATTGIAGRDELPFAVPRNARVAGFIPYADLLPKVTTVISNGGWGGTLRTLAHDIPLVIAGGDLDKPEIAARVAWSGAGVNLRTGTPNAGAVLAGYDRITADPAFRDAASRVGAELRSLGGAARAADLLEGLVGQTP